jgi:hypothetical protein
MSPGVYVTGRELGGTPDNVPATQTVFSGKPVGPVTVQGTMTIQNPINKVEISVTAVVKYSSDVYTTTTGKAIVALPTDGSSAAYKVSIISDTRSVSVSHTDSKTDAGVKAEIAAELGLASEDVGSAKGGGKLAWGITPDKTKSDATQTTYTVSVPTDKFSITAV